MQRCAPLKTFPTLLIVAAYTLFFSANRLFFQQRLYLRRSTIHLSDQLFPTTSSLRLAGLSFLGLLSAPLMTLLLHLARQFVHLHRLLM